MDQSARLALQKEINQARMEIILQTLRSEVRNLAARKGFVVNEAVLQNMTVSQLNCKISTLDLFHDVEK